MYFDTLAEHSDTVLWTVRTTKLCFPVWYRNFKIGFNIGKKKSIYVCNIIFSWYKHITHRFSNGMPRVAIRYSTKKSDHISSPDFYSPSLIRQISFASQPHLVHVITFWQYTYLWTTVKDYVPEEQNFTKNLCWTPCELTKNYSHCHQTRLMH